MALARREYRVGHNRVAQLIRKKGLGVRLRKRFRFTTGSKQRLPVAEDLLKRYFKKVPWADHTSVSDLSYIPTFDAEREALRGILRKTERRGIIMTKQMFPLIEVAGDAYTMGRAHGEQAKTLVHLYLQWIERLTGMPRDRLCTNAMHMLPAMEAISPRLIEEIRGLKDGADISFEEAVLCQARAEASHTYEGGCSAFALTGAATADGHPLAGQNQDLEPEYADIAILLRVKPDDGRPAALMFTFAGQLGYSGMNAHGVAHFANALYDFRWTPGLPHYPLKRVMLEQKTVGECIALLQAHRTCSAANLVLADSQGAIGDVEVRPEGIAVYGDECPDMRLHTNHYVTPEYRSLETHSLPDSCPRLDRLRKLVHEAWGTITVDTMKTILADHEGDPGGICRHGERQMHSISGYIAEPARRILHVRRGHGCLGSWAAYEV